MAADHGGLACKNEIKAWLTAAGIQVVDVGAEKLVSDDDYSTWARAAVVAKKADTEAKIIAWCRSGVGMCIALNRAPGIYATVATDERALAAAVADDHINALCLAADYTDLSVQKTLIGVFLETDVRQEERFGRRLSAVERMGQEFYADNSSDFAI